MITVSLPGVAYRCVCDGGFPNDDPARWQRISASAVAVRAGFGRTYRLTLSDHDAADLHDYIDSLVGVLASMSGEERGETGGSELAACRTASGRLLAARGRVSS